MSVVVALDIGGTRLRAAVFPSEGIAPILVRYADTHGLEAGVFQRLTDLIDSIWPKDRVGVISAAVPGPLNPHTGMILKTPNIPTWVNFHLTQELNDRYHVKSIIGNDANLAALAEWKYGSGQRHHDLLYLTISTGIGGGVISHDLLLEGCHGMAAELGHVLVLSEGPFCSCGKRGHLEAVSSGTAIVRYVRERIALGSISSLSEKSDFSARDVAEAASQGDALAVESLSVAGEFIGQALAGFLHIFNPSMVIFGGGVTQSGRLLLDPIKNSLERYVMNPAYLEDLQIKVGSLGDNAGLLGALAQARMYLSN